MTSAPQDFWPARRSLRLLNLLVPLLLVSAVVAVTGGIATEIRASLRWVVMGVLAMSVVMTPFPLRPAAGVIAAALAYALWIVMTAAWSAVPLLSAAKALAFFLVAIAGLGGGHLWVVTRDRSRALDFLWLSTLLTVAAGWLGGGSAEGTLGLRGGLTGSNALGTMVVLCVPLVLWRLITNGRTGASRLPWLVLGSVQVFLLYLTRSRGAWVILICTVLGLLMVIRLRWLIVVTTLIVTAATLVTSVAPAATAEWVDRNVYKLRDPELGIFASREAVWGESYAAATEGGWFGVGFGVSVGADPSAFQSLIMIGQYGREKGSSPLAVAEETGLVGLGLYGVLLAALFGTLAVGTLRAAGELRIAMGLVGGVLAGLIVESIVEAWWGAPGSPVTIFFWVYAGAGLGLASLVRRDARSNGRSRRPVTPAPTS